MAKKTCAEAANLYEDVLRCPGVKRLPGTRAYGWLIRRAFITAMAEPQKESATALKDYLVIKDSHTLAADKKWIKVEFLPDKSSIAPEAQGEEGSKTMNNKATLVLPGTEEEQQALASILLNDDCIFLVPQRNGKVRQFGDDAFHVSVTPSATTGASVTDEANTTLEISVACDTMPPFYYGDIVTEEGTFSGETCKLKTVVTKPGQEK